MISYDLAGKTGTASNETAFFSLSTRAWQLAAGSRKTLASDPQATIGNVVPCYGTDYIIFTWAGHEQRQSIWRVNADGSNITSLTPGKNDAAIT